MISKDRLRWLRGAVIAAASLEYAAIAAMGVWAMWFYVTGASDDMPSLLYVLMSVAFIAIGFIPGYGAYRLCEALGDSHSVATAWGSGTALMAPPLAVGAALSLGYAQCAGSLVAGIAVSFVLTMNTRMLSRSWHLLHNSGSRNEGQALRRRLYLWLSTLVLLLFCCVAAVWFTTHLSRSDVSIGEVQKIISARFTGDVRLIHSQVLRRGGRRVRVWGKVEMSRSAADGFVRQLRISRFDAYVASRTDKLGIGRQADKWPVPSWYRPGAARHFIAVRYALAGAGGRGAPYSVEVLVDMTGSGEHVAVYVARRF